MNKLQGAYIDGLKGEVGVRFKNSLFLVHRVTIIQAPVGRSTSHPLFPYLMASKY